MVVPGLAVLVVAWAVGLVAEDQVFPFPTVFGTRAPVPVSLLAATVGLMLITYGLDRSRTPVERTANRALWLWDVSWSAVAAAVSVATGAAAALAGNPEGPAMARAVVAGLGGYLVARSVVRVDLAALAPLGLLIANSVLWDIRVLPDAGPWLFSASDDAVSWGVSVLLLVLGLGCLATQDQRLHWPAAPP
ncbi:hypothetical protein ACFXKD_19630 [Nocardiopsis aegyptia]|uniref:hypothetical protein n=1 Tax=Nocardiopsis aegyptia TaxID=220378 RepID=UPI0036725889